MSTLVGRGIGRARIPIMASAPALPTRRRRPVINECMNRGATSLGRTPSIATGQAAGRANGEERFGGAKGTVVNQQSPRSPFLKQRLPRGRIAVTVSLQCLLCPQKRTLVERVGMSALCQKQTSGPSLFD